jgi:hypothetical protein
MPDWSRSGKVARPPEVGELEGGARMTETIVDRQTRLDRLSILYQILQHQRDVLAALSQVLDMSPPPNDDTIDRAAALQQQVAVQVVVTCESIWAQYGPVERSRP